MSPGSRLTLFLLLLMSLFISACAGARTTVTVPPAVPGANPYAPKTGDGAMQRGEVRIVTSSLDSTSLDGRAMVKFDYFLPTPCHQLRIEVDHAGAEARIDITAYSLIESGRVCTLMQLATPQHAALTLAGYPAGNYSLWLNGEPIGDWQQP